jgi:hypothetical protein
MLDEIDAIFGDRAGDAEGIRSLFNSGNRRGTKVPRLVAKGKTFEFVEFDVFCPKATAGIGGLPDTILDRAIVIPMERRAKGERAERLRERTARSLGRPIRAALEIHLGRLTSFTVDDDLLPTELDDRAQDGWEPLFAVADAAGGEWPARVRSAAVAIFGRRRSDDDNLQLRLLGDVKAVFDAVSVDFLPTAALRDALVVLEESPWADVKGKPVTPHYIGRLLKKFEIESIRDRPTGSGNPIRGFHRGQFTEAWSRYLSQESGTSDTSGTAEPDAAGAAEVVVPDVPDVPHPQPGLTRRQQADLISTVFDVFSEDLESMPGLA